MLEKEFLSNELLKAIRLQQTYRIKTLNGIQITDPLYHKISNEIEIISRKISTDNKKRLKKEYEKRGMNKKEIRKKLRSEIK